MRQIEQKRQSAYGSNNDKVVAESIQSTEPNYELTDEDRALFKKNGIELTFYN